MINIKSYDTLVFDCDGVVLDSNRVKTDAFFRAVLPYGEKVAQELVKHHIAHGGVSRYKKFTHFIENILPNHDTKNVNFSYEELLERYANFTYEGLLSCDIAEGLAELREQTKSNWLIVSGGDQNELRDIFTKRGIADWFDGGIFGSPDPKEIILDRELNNGNITKNSLFLGDSKYDYKAATSSNLDFIFLYGWSEVESWQEWVLEFEIFYTRNMTSDFLAEEYHNV